MATTSHREAGPADIWLQHPERPRSAAQLETRDFNSQASKAAALSGRLIR